jgi:hypothetical protein
VKLDGRRRFGLDGASHQSPAPRGAVRL